MDTTTNTTVRDSSSSTLAARRPKRLKARPPPALRSTISMSGRSLLEWMEWATMLAATTNDIKKKAGRERNNPVAQRGAFVASVVVVVAAAADATADGESSDGAPRPRAQSLVGAFTVYKKSLPPYRHFLPLPPHKFCPDESSMICEIREPGNSINEWRMNGWADER